MAGNQQQRRGRKPEYIAYTGTGGQRRWLASPWLWMAGVAAVIGFPLLRDATSEKMLRNRYADEASCRCDYGDRCNLDRQTNQWLGPWYARNAADRKPDDPGPGQCRTGDSSSGSSGGGYHGGVRYLSSATADDEDTHRYRGPVATEEGLRGGFGSSARVRAAGS